MSKLSGYRTYIVAILAAAAAAAFGMGYITREQYEVIMGLLIAGGGATLRAAVARNAVQSPPQPPQAPRT